MNQRLLLLVLIACLAVPVTAQQSPAGWKMRVDRSQNAQDPDDRPDLKFVSTAKGFHVTGGPAGTFWQPAQTATGDYTLKATFTLVKPSNHVNYYGLVFGGGDLDGANQTYTYFVVAQNGTYLVRHRSGESVQDVARGTNDAIKRPDSSGSSVNALEARVAGNTIAYVVNGTVVHTTPKTGAVARTDGLVGVRVNHVLDVQFEGLEVQKR